MFQTITAPALKTGPALTGEHALTEQKQELVLIIMIAVQLIISLLSLSLVGSVFQGKPEAVLLLKLVLELNLV